MNMKRALIVWMASCFCLATILMASSARAQAPAPEGREAPPEIEIRSFAVQPANVAGGDKPWLRLLANFVSRPTWADGIVFYYDILLESNGEYRVLSGAARYSNVKRGSHSAVMFMSPSSVERFGSPVAAVVRSGYKDDLSGEITWEAQGKNAPDNWVEQFQRYPNQLLPITSTPFVATEYGKYPDAINVPQ